MDILGVICEYNPFHLGHEYMMNKIGSYLSGDRAVVCCMSGNFVQRGEAAVMRKQARAEAAVRCGADLVLELPVPWALASAESFAAGGVQLLTATGVVTHLGFGSECGDINELSVTAELLLSPDMDALIKEELGRGISYAAARQRALERLGGRADIVASPNNILAVEYLKALRRQNSPLIPLTAERIGAGHDQPGETGILSASELRRRIAAGMDVRGLMPEAAYAVLCRERQAGLAPADMRSLETAILSRLRFLPESAFARLPGAAEGLERRLFDAVHSQPGIEEVLAAAKTRRYAMSRLRRMLTGAAIGLDKETAAGGIPYIRVMALSRRGRGLLREMEDRASLPVITKPAHVKRLDRRAVDIFRLESGADDLYCLGFENKDGRLPGSLWRESPFVER